MSVTTDLLNKVIEEVLPDTVRAGIVDGELIVNAAALFNRHALYGEPLELPEPLNRTIDTSIFER